LSIGCKLSLANRHGDVAAGQHAYNEANQLLIPVLLASIGTPLFSAVVPDGPRKPAYQPATRPSSRRPPMKSRTGSRGTGSAQTVLCVSPSSRR